MKLKGYEIVYYDNYGTVSIYLEAANITALKKKFYREFGYYEIESITEKQL